MKKKLSKVMAVMLILVMILSATCINTAAASYPILFFMSDENFEDVTVHTTATVGDVVNIRMDWFAEYKNEGYDMYIYNSNDQVVGSASSTWYNTGLEKHITVRWDTKGLKSGLYTVKVTKKFYSLYRWNEAPTKDTLLITLEDKTISPPTIKKLENTTKGVKLSWDKVSDEYGYRVYRKNSNGAWRRLVNDTTSTSFTDSSVTPNKSETYTIRCIDKNGKLISDYNKNGWSITYKPVSPTISLKNTANGIQIKWNKIAGVDTYRVYCKNSSGKWVGLKNVKGTTFTDTDVKIDKTKTYTIRCVNKNGNLVSDYNKNGWTIKYKPVAPTLSLKNTSKGIQISWNKIAGVDTYRVYCKNSSGKWVGLKNVKGTSMIDTSVKSGITKTYTIRCVDKNGKLISDYNNKGWKITYRK